MQQPRKTFSTILDEHRGIGPGFDALRIGLALAVFLFHVPPLFLQSVHLSDTMQSMSHGVINFRDIKQPIHLALLPMFFAVSGFLVLGSALRVRSVPTFLAFRVLRIFPALATEVVLSAIVLGGVFTTLSLADYYSSYGFFRYFGNMVGWVVFDLPGVFTGNHRTTAVNANLWTLPPEFDCYLITALLMASGLLFRRWVMTVAFGVLTTVFIVLNTFGNFSVVSSTEHFPSYVITYYFFVGMMFYYWREYVLYSWPLLAVSAIAAYTLLYFQHTVFLAPVFLTYCVLFLGFVPVPKSKILASGDYSYGIYLYGFPISQAVIAASPGLQGHLVYATVLALTATILFAVFSWHMIEKPTLAFKKRLPAGLFPRAPKAAPLPEQRVEQGSFS